MPDYGFLVLPSHNRVYSLAAAELAAAELAVFGERAMDGRIGGIARTELGGVPYVTFSADELTERDLRLLSNLSSLYALFAIEDGRLTPLAKQPLDLFGSELLTIQKYPGKTNEDFTKLLLNVTALASDRPLDLVAGRPRVLDPMCGRGTTLNQALMYGWDAAGVDVDGKDVDAYALFLRTWLKHSRLKHQADLTTVRRAKAVLGRRFQATVGATKERYKAGETIEVTAVHADTLRSGDFFRPASFDLVVTDAPYGVQHGSRQGGLSRGPAELLEAAVPVWAGLLRAGGAIGISWNTHVARRARLAGILDENGFEVQESAAYLGFEHRVDQAILRDLIVARKR